MSQRTCLILGLLVLLFQPACAFLASLLPWNTTGKTTHEVKDNKDVQLTPANPSDWERDRDHPHACCGDSENTIWYERCDQDGSKNPDGEYMCCHGCGKVCFRRPAEMSSDSECSGGKRHCYDLTGDPQKGYSCAHCNQACTLSPNTAKPPVPIPLPDCDRDKHCTVKESCKIGDGPCCAKCHQACPPWKSDQDDGDEK